MRLNLALHIENLCCFITNNTKKIFRGCRVIKFDPHPGEVTWLLKEVEVVSDLLQIHSVPYVGNQLSDNNVNAVETLC